MTNKYDDLIEDLRENWMNDAIPTADTQNQVYQALRECGEEKFNVLDHLNGGGKAISDCKNVCFKTPLGDIQWVNSGIIVRSRELLNGNWQPYKEPLMMPEDNKVYWVTYKGHVQDTPFKWLNGSFVHSDGDGGYKDVNGPIFQPLRNEEDNSLYECVKPDVKGG